MKKTFFGILYFLGLFACQKSFSQDLLYIKSNEEGRGVLIEKNDQCYAVIPYHLIDKYRGEILVINQDEEIASAEYVTHYEEYDLAIVVIKNQGSIKCRGWVNYSNTNEIIDNINTADLEILDENGFKRVIPVSFKGKGKRIIKIKPTDPDDILMKTMSGSALFTRYEGEKRLVGILQSLDANLKNVGNVLQIDDIQNITSDFFPTKIIKMNVNEAQIILDRAIERQDGTDQGQIEAIEALLANDFTFDNYSFSGLYLEKLNFLNGNATNSGFTGTMMSKCQVEGSNFNKSRFAFSTLNDANFRNTQMVDVYAPFLEAKNANFDGADLEGAYFLSGNFEGASFKNANLKNCVFAYCNLKDVDLRGANLTNTFFTTSLMFGTKFSPDTKFGNTDLNYAMGDWKTISEGQIANSCRCQNGNDFLFINVQLIESENWRYPLKDEFLRFANTPNTSLKTCKVVRTYHDFEDKRLRFDPTSRYPIKIYFSEKFIQNGDRRKKFSDRISAHFDIIRKYGLNTEKYINGKLDKGDAQISYIRKRIKNVRPKNRQYASRETLFLINLKKGVIHPDSVDWFRKAWSEYNYPDTNMWASIFDRTVPWVDVPIEKVDLFKQWTLNRSKYVNDSLMIKTKGNGAIPKYYGRYYEFRDFERVGSEPRASSELGKYFIDKGIPLENVRQSFFRDNGIAIFPKPVKSYLKKYEDMGNFPLAYQDKYGQYIKYDVYYNMLLSKIETYDGVDPSGVRLGEKVTTLIYYVTPVLFEIRKDGRVVFQEGFN